MKPSVIRCSKCGYQSNVINDTCIKCGASLVKICGNCELINAVEKNYCDACGSLLALKVIAQDVQQGENKQQKPPDVKIAVEFEPINETIEKHADSFRKRQETNLQKQALEIANKDEKVEIAKREKDKLAELESKKNINENKSKPVETPKKHFSKYAIYLAILIAFISVLWLLIAPKIPSMKLVLTARKYLTALKEKNYSQAYSYLSNNSKFTCPFTDYVKYNDAYYSQIKGGWEFKDVSVFKMEKNGAIVKYWLKEGDGAWREDYISFVKEHDRWVRPYIWHLFAPIDEAIARGDFSQALYLAQKLYLTDPMDPRASGYLCNSEYLMNLYDKAIESCKRTLEAQALYPVGFSKDEIFWFTFYYADSLRFMARFQEALQVYEELFNFEDIASKNKCPLLMSRADAYVRLGDFQKAQSDIQLAVSLCPDGINKKEALKRQFFLSLDASEEAINMAQRARVSPDTPTVLEQRSAVLSAINKDAQKGVYFKDEWKAEKQDGPIYLVSIIQVKYDKRNKKLEEYEVYRASVNLWTGSVKMVSK